MKNSQKGFTVVTASLIVAIVLAAGIGTWYYETHSTNFLNKIVNIPMPSTMVPDISIPATSTPLTIITQDEYGLFMAPSDMVNQGYFNYYGGVYLKDGVIEDGPLAGYNHLLFSYDSPDCEMGVCVGTPLSLATKDYKSFVLDNGDMTESSLKTLASDQIYLNTTKIASQNTIAFAFPKTISSNGVVFNRDDEYSTSLPTKSETLVQSTIQGLPISYDYNASPAGSTSSSNTDAANKYTNTVNNYVASFSSSVRARDAVGVTTTYSMSAPSLYRPYDVLKSVASGAIFTSYGSEGCNDQGSWYVLKNISDSDLVLVGTNQSGVAIYALKDFNHLLNQAAYYSEVSSVQDFSAKNDGISAPSYDDFVAKLPILIIKDPFGRFLAIDEIQYNYSNYGDCGGKKPVIYLYPQKTTPVTVQFAKPINLSLNIPAYANGWSVLAHPDGELQDLQSQPTDCSAIDSTALGSEYAQEACEKNNYPYLYWAGYIGQSFPHLSDGWVIAQGDTKSFLEEKLTEVGFNQKEKNDMISYWVPELSAFGAPYYRISFLQTAQMDALVPLAISPKPDNEYRLFLLWSPLSLEPSIQPQPEILHPVVRKGFTVVEWGGGEQF